MNGARTLYLPGTGFISLGRERLIPNPLGGNVASTKEGKMDFLEHKWRVLTEAFGLLVAAVMGILAVAMWAGDYSWGLDGSNFIAIATIALLASIYLVLDETRLTK
jgi:hypothetical protein